MTLRRRTAPAFGAYAGGLNACDAAFKPLFPNGFTAHLIGDSRLFHRPGDAVPGLKGGNVR